MKNSKGFGLVELIIVIAVLAFIVDISMPKIQSYISHKKESENNSVMLEVAVYNVKSYVSQVNQNLVLNSKTNGSYYVSDINISLSGIIPTGDSWIVVDNNKVTKGMFKEPCGSSYAYISYQNETFTTLEENELIDKP